MKVEILPYAGHFDMTLHVIALKRIRNEAKHRLGQNIELQLKENPHTKTTFIVPRSYTYQDKSISFQVTISCENQNLLKARDLLNKKWQ